GADQPTVLGAYVAGGGRQVTSQECCERALADEANPGAVLFLGHRQALFPCDRTHLPFRQIAEGKDDVLEIGAPDGVEKIALVLLGVASLEQLRCPAIALEPRVVPRREPSGAEAARVAAQDTELDLTVTEHVRIRGLAQTVLAQEVVEDALTVLCGETRSMQRQPQLSAYPAGILEIRRCLAVAIVFPIAHVQALHLVALLQKQRGGDGGIDSA